MDARARWALLGGLVLVGCSDDSGTSGGTEGTTSTDGTLTGSSTGTAGTSSAGTTDASSTSDGTTTDATTGPGSETTGSGTTGAGTTGSGTTGGSTTGDETTGSGTTSSGTTTSGSVCDACDPVALCDPQAPDPCTCPDGYTGDGLSCDDIDECAQGNPCPAEATCENTEGGYVCNCGGGMWSDGTACVPGGTTSFAASYNQAVAVADDGTLRRWGADTDDPLTGPRGSGTPAVLEASTGWRQVSPYCATKTDGTLWCWPPQRSAPGPGAATIDLATDWSFVSAESGIACAVKTDGTLHCWGGNAAGQLGIPAIPDQGTDAPAQVGGDDDWVTTAVTVKVGCAVKESGAVWCWGGNDEFTGFNGSDEPVEMESPGPIAYAKGRVEGLQVVVEALAVDGTLWRWASLGASPTQIGTRDDWHRASLGAAHKCAIRSNKTLHCWGSLLKVGVNPGDDAAPTRVGTGSDWVEVETSEGTYLTGASCARDSIGDLYCFGHDGVGELGRGTIGSAMEPETIASPGGVFTDVRATGIQTCGTRQDGTIACWGLVSRWDSPGIWETSLRQVPDTVGTESDWAEVSPGGAFTCARKTGGTAWCWGSLVNGLLPMTGVPTQVGIDEDWTSVVSGYLGACGLRGGALYCWGTFSPWLGSNTTPTQVGTDSDWTEVDASVAVCGLRQGQLWCANGYRAHATPERLGDDSDWLTIAVSDADSCGIRGASLPGEIWCVLRATDILYRMGNDADWIDVAAMKGGGTFEGFCGVRNDGTLWCWGMDFTESTGSPTMTSPVKFGSDTDYVAVATSGLSHACGLTGTGVVRCFGQAAGGALGNDRAWSIDPVGPVDLQ